jgi:S-adenosylmethionine:tRNA ribosyltransferase-isomerase
VRVSDFRFELPERLIAHRPVEPRDAARLLVYERASRRAVHRRVADLPELLADGDLLVFNDTRVLACRLVGRRPTGGRIEVTILERQGDLARGYVKPARKLRVGAPVQLEGGRVELEPLADLGGGVFRFRLSAEGDLDQALEEVGRAPLPPYLHPADAEDDRERYQTVFARVPGAVAAPTAGLHFTDSLLARLRARSVELAWVTLHVGEGTFAPVRAELVEHHVMHAERYELPAATAAAVDAARRRGRRVIAVGTTSARVLESRATASRTVSTGSGETRLFLYPGRPLRVVDALLTNFHLPESTLLMLVAALVGREELLELYREAVRLDYRSATRCSCCDRIGPAGPPRRARGGERARPRGRRRRPAGRC